MKQKEDLRITRTKKMIKDAFIHLFQEKSYEQITIQDIANEAMINLNSLSTYDQEWYWIDFDNPRDFEIDFFRNQLKFHHLAIEDSIYSLNKPKLDYYEGYNFLILNSLREETLDPAEITLFVGENYIVSFHIEGMTEVDEAWERVTKDRDHSNEGPTSVAYQIMDKIVDRYFPAFYKIEDKLGTVHGPRSFWVKHSYFQSNGG